MLFSVSVYLVTCKSSWFNLECSRHLCCKSSWFNLERSQHLCSLPERSTKWWRAKRAKEQENSPHRVRFFSRSFQPDFTAKGYLHFKPPLRLWFWLASSSRALVCPCSRIENMRKGLKEDALASVQYWRELRARNVEVEARAVCVELWDCCCGLTVKPPTFVR